MLRMRRLPERIKTNMEPNSINKTEPGQDVSSRRVTSVEAVAQVSGLACAYPYPHSILGKETAAGYVETLLSGRREHMKSPGVDGWYMVSDDLGACAACHLSIYGVGNGNGHTLWKIRHPLERCENKREGNSQEGPQYLQTLFNDVCRIAFRARPGSAKVVLFLGEHEVTAHKAALGAGFEKEACFRDYYRLGESCYVYGRTITEA